MGREVRGEPSHVGRAAGAVTDRVEQHLHAAQPGLGIEAQAEVDDLRVDGRSRVADRLHVELPELAVAAGLRPVVAEHRARQGQPHGLWERLHAVLDVRPHQPGGRLRPQCPPFAFRIASAIDALANWAKPCMASLWLLRRGDKWLLMFCISAACSNVLIVDLFTKISVINDI